MPRPVYIVCARGICEDKTTGLFSIFQVLEKVAIGKTQVQRGDEVAEAEARGTTRGTLEAFNMRAVAVWMKSLGDEGQTFEHEFAIRHEGRFEEVSGSQPFAFEKNKMLHRFTLNMKGFPILEETGMVELVSRVRKEGDEEWLDQSYPLFVEMTEQRSGTAAAPGQRTHGTR